MALVKHAFISGFIFSQHIKDVAAAAASNADIIGMAVAACAGFVLLSAVVSIALMFIFRNLWFDKWMAIQGKVKMPRAYFQRKKEASKRSLIPAKKTQDPHANGSIPLQPLQPVIKVKDFSTQQQFRKTASTNNIQNVTVKQTTNNEFSESQQVTKTRNTKKQLSAWHQGNPSFINRVYEEKDVTVQLGEELDEEYKIETEVVDNEILDVGPFKADHTHEVPIKGNVYSDPYLYSTVDRTSRTNQNVTSTKDKRRPNAEHTTNGEIKASSFEPSLLYL